MGLKIYTSASPDASISENGSLTDPYAISLDGRSGGAIQHLLYVRNDDTNLTYSGIYLTVIDSVDPSVVDGSTGQTWKLSAGTTQPSDDLWKQIDSANTITLSGLGTTDASDTSTYLGFWVRTEIPRGTSVQTITDIQFQITAQELLLQLMVF